MIAEKRLIEIIKAADPDDSDDVQIRTLLAAALKESSSIHFKGRPRGQLASATSSCELRASQPMAASPFRRTRRAFSHRCR